MNIKNNRVKVSVVSADAPDTKRERVYELDVGADPFFDAHAGDLFPDAIAANEEDMKEVTKKEEHIRSKVCIRLPTSFCMRE